MALYTSEQLSGAGTPMEALTAGVEVDFILKRPVDYLSGSGYFTVETIPNLTGSYSGQATNAIGTYGIEAGAETTEGFVTSSYISSVIVQPTINFTSSYTFIPTADILISSSMLRATGGISLEIGSIAEPYTFTTRTELKTAVDLWESDRAAALATYGEINTWDVSQVTDMSELFEDKTTFNDDISNWDVSNVTNMDLMFANATAFNQNIGTWNVSSVTAMYQMFINATSFNGPINNWNVSNVTDMREMFSFASAFQQPLNLWELDSLTTATLFMGITGGAGAITYTLLDTLLNGWVVDFAALPSNVNISFGDSTFTSAGLAARNILVNDKGWTITDGGQV